MAPTQLCYGQQGPNLDVEFIVHPFSTMKTSQDPVQYFISKVKIPPLALMSL